MGDEPTEPKHVFASADLAMVYQGLMTLLEAINDLKMVILHTLDEDCGASGRG